MKELELKLDQESADALKMFATSMPAAVQDILRSTQLVVQAYQAVSDEVGPHSEDFKNMLLMIKAAQEKAADAINELPPKLLKTAEKIELYLAKKSEVSGN